MPAWVLISALGLGILGVVTNTLGRSRQKSRLLPAETKPMSEK
jgi:hypothetical protein